MQTKDEMIGALQMPEKAPFRVAFEVFASPDRQDIAKWPKKLADLMNTPIRKLIPRHLRKNLTAQAAEEEKARLIASIRENDLVTATDRLLTRFEQHTARYNKLKDYFNQKIPELGLTNPLIFFDDKAQRIDIGYGPKEMPALFLDFFDYRGVFDEIVLGKVSFRGKSPLDYFLEDYIEDDYKRFLRAEKRRIYSSALAEFSKPLAAKKTVIIEKTKGFTEAELVKKCFATNNALIIGEAHGNQSSKQFLVDNMPLFKSLGVTIMYMQHLLQERHQLLLDAYLHSPPDAAMPRELGLYLACLDTEHDLSGSATFTAVVNAAKTHQIRIVAIDSEATYSLGVVRSLRDLSDTKAQKRRFRVMNMAMLERYREFNDGGNCIAFMGSGHISTYLGVPGVSDLLNCPNIAIYDLYDHLEECIVPNALFKPELESIYFDILYYRHRGTKQPVAANVVTLTSSSESKHQQKLANTFFTRNQTEESQRLDNVKQACLDDEKQELGLVSKFQ